MIFVDTGPLLARYITSDQYHKQAESRWADLAASSTPLLTTNLVIAEFLTLLARRASADFAAERGRKLYASPNWTIHRPGESEETHAIVLLERFGQQGVGFVDCVSFATMQALGIRQAYTFDAHFVEAGFEMLPEV